MVAPEIPLVTGVPGEGLIITPVKKLIIRALRATFTAMYPDDKLSELNIDLEYPYKQEQYPGIWVRFSPSKLQASGLSPNIYTEDEIYGVWHFEGTISLIVIALSSKERDLIADGIIEAYAFASLMPSASPLYTTITSSNLINMTLQSDIITPGGQT